MLPAYAMAVGGVYAVYPSSRHLSPAIKAFVELAAERLSRAAAHENCAPEALGMPAA